MINIASKNTPTITVARWVGKVKPAIAPYISASSSANTAPIWRAGMGLPSKMNPRPSSVPTAMPKSAAIPRCRPEIIIR